MIKPESYTCVIVGCHRSARSVFELPDNRIAPVCVKHLEELLLNLAEKKGRAYVPIGTREDGMTLMKQVPTAECN